MVEEASLETAAPPRSLGIGFTYISVLPAELYQSGIVDFVEITPETLCLEHHGARRSMGLVSEQLHRARETCNTLPIVVHGVELSIGSAHGWNTAYLDMLDTFQREWPFLWHSEHLGFQTMIADDAATSLDIGVPLPLPPTEEAVRLVSSRCLMLRERYGVPFLLENPAHYLTDLPVDPVIGDEIALMTRITERGRCAQLLDLHNLHCNAVNHGFDAFAAIDRMALDSVMEIHVAGGAWREGFWMDSHDGRVPEPVWEMLDYTLPRTPNVCGLVFELLGEKALQLGADAIAEELGRARTMWRQHRDIED